MSTAAKHEALDETVLGQWRRHGYAVVPRFIPKALVGRALQEIWKTYPTDAELRAKPRRYSGLLEDPEQLQMEFPFAAPTLNDLATHPAFGTFGAGAFGHNDVVLTQAATWVKYAGVGDFEQGMHLDYQGNTLVVPRADADYEQINAILYLTDVTADMGPTCVVSREQTKGLPVWPAFRTRQLDPGIYKQEKKVLVPAGSLLLFSMSTFHRASQITAETGARVSLHLIFRSSRHAFAGFYLYSKLGEKPELGKFVQRASVEQRALLGFPRPGNAYWTAETLAGVGLRYPKMDMKPYRVGVGK